MSQAKSLYDILGVKKTDSCNDIKKAYLKMARIHHPDKGGDPERFKEIAHANEVLTDERRRKLYDDTGLTDEKQAEVGSSPFPGGFPFPFEVNMNDLFGNMFGGPPRGGPIRKNKKPAPYIQQISVTLEQYYIGNKFDIKINRNSFCGECGHSGAKTKEMCRACNGQGSVTQVLHMGPVAMQTSGPCMECQAKGEKVIESCPKCNGSGFVSETRNLSIRMVPGTKSQESFIFPEVCSDHDAFERPGDAHIIITDDPNDVAFKHFRRSGAQQEDLHTEITLSLAESLVGCVVRIDYHPGYDEGLFVRIPPGSFEGDRYRMNGFGMPLMGQIGKYGDLYVHVHVTIHPRERQLFETKATELLRPLFQEHIRKIDCKEDSIQSELHLHK